MKWMWKRKWIVLPLAAAIILAAGAVGAVALASPGDSGAAAGALSAGTATVTTASAGASAAGDLSGLAGLLGERKAKLQQRLENLKQRWGAARATMSPEDQAAFDQFLQKAKDQRDTLKQDRQDLLQTLKSMRDLVKKYQPAATTTTS
jgi:hypothetical protein